jgi:hypothetical protein
VNKPIVAIRKTYYLGKKPCGCVAAVIAEPEATDKAGRRVMIRTLGAWRLAGLEVEGVITEQTPLIDICRHKPAPVVA